MHVKFLIRLLSDASGSTNLCRSESEHSSDQALSCSAAPRRASGGVCGQGGVMQVSGMGTVR